MKVQYNSNVYDVPDEIGNHPDPAVVRSYIDKMNTPDPTVWERVKGNLAMGTSDLASSVANITGLVGLHGIEKGYNEIAQTFAGQPSAKAVTAKPAESTLGSVAEGLVRFAPQIPLYAAGEGVVMGAGKMLPGVVGRGFKALEAVKGEPFIKEWAKAVPRAALSGAAVGSVAAPPESTIGERATHAYEEAKGFAIGVGILHPAFAGLRKAVGLAVGKRSARIRSDADVASALADEKVRTKLMEDADISNSLKQYEDMRDAQAATDVDYKNKAWFKDTTGKEEPLGFGLEDTTKPTEPPPGGGIPSGAEAGAGGAPFDKSIMEGGTAPAWVKENIATLASSATPEQVSAIERLSVARMTAAEVAAKTGIDKEVIRAVRAQRGIPSMDDTVEFNKWVAAQEPVLPPGAAEALAAQPAPLTPPPALGGVVKRARAKASATVEQKVELQKRGYSTEQVDKISEAKAAEIVAKPIEDTTKKVSLKNVPADIARDLLQTGMTQEEIKAITTEVEGQVPRHKGRLSKINFTLSELGYLPGEVEKLPFEKKVSIIEQNMVETRLEEELAKRRPAAAELEPVQYTPEQVAQQRVIHEQLVAQREQQLLEQAQNKKFKKAGIDPLSMTAEQRTTKYNELVGKDVKDTVADVTSGEKLRTIGLERASEVLEDLKVSKATDMAPEKIDQIKADIARLIEHGIEVENKAVADRAAGLTETQVSEGVVRRRRRLPEEVAQPSRRARELTPEQRADMTADEIKAWEQSFEPSEQEKFNRELNDLLESEPDAPIEDLIKQANDKMAGEGVGTAKEPTVVKTAEDWNSVLEGEGLGELRNEDGTIMDFMGLQKMYEMASQILKKSTDLNELSKVGRGLMLEGSESFPRFKARMQDIAGENWPAVRGHVKDIYDQSRAWHTRLGEDLVITNHGTKVFFQPNERGEIAYDLGKAGSGEGAAYRGWGIYETLRTEKGQSIAEKGYAERLARRANEREAEKASQLKIGDTVLDDRFATDTLRMMRHDWNTLKGETNENALYDNLKHFTKMAIEATNKEIKGYQDSLRVGEIRATAKGMGDKEIADIAQIQETIKRKIADMQIKVNNLEALATDLKSGMPIEGIGSGPERIMIGSQQIDQGIGQRVFGMSLREWEDFKKLSPGNMNEKLSMKAQEYIGYLERDIEQQKAAIETRTRLIQSPAATAKTIADAKVMMSLNKDQLEASQSILTQLHEFANALASGLEIRKEGGSPPKYKPTIYITAHARAMEDKLIDLDEPLKAEHRDAIIKALDGRTDKKTRAGMASLSELLRAERETKAEPAAATPNYDPHRMEYKEDMGKSLADDIVDPFTGNVVFVRGTILTNSVVQHLGDMGIERVLLVHNAGTRGPINGYSILKPGTQSPFANGSTVITKQVTLDNGGIIPAGTRATTETLHMIAKDAPTSVVMIKSEINNRIYTVKARDLFGTRSDSVPQISGNGLQWKLWEIFGDGDTHATGARKKTSEFLRDEADIPGSKFISDSGGERTYVWFDPSHKKFIKEYTLDFMGLSQGLEMIFKASRALDKDNILATAKEMGVALEGKGGAEFLKDRRPALDKVRVWEPLVRIPMRIAEKIGGTADRLVFNLNVAEMKYKHALSSDNGIYPMFRSVRDTLSADEQINLTKAMDGKVSPMNEKVAVALAKMKDYTDQTWDKVLTSKMASFESHLKPEEYQAIKEVINKGMDENMVFAKFGEKDAEVLSGLVEDYKSLQAMKKANYRPHYERGDILLVEMIGDKKKVRAVAMSEKDAVRKALRLKEAEPDLQLLMDTNFAQDLPTGLTKPQYWAITRRLATEADKQLKAINEDISKGASTLAARRAMRGVFVIKPTDKFSPYMLPRHEQLKGEENVFDSIFAYAYSVEKKLALDPVIAESRRVINEDYAGDPNTQSFLRELVEDTKGKYSWQDKAADDIMHWMGKSDASMTATKAAAAVRSVEGPLKLAYRPVAALFNYLGGQSNVWVKFGTKYFTDGYAFLRTAEGKQFMKEMEPVMGQTFVHEGEGLSVKRGHIPGTDIEVSPWLKPMGWFEAPEIPNRSIGLAAPYLYAKGELKLSESAAREFAIRQNWFSQATYNLANLPSLMRSPAGRVAGQFKTYMINQLEFMASLRGPEIARYITAQVALGGPRGAVAFLKSLPILAMMPFWDELEDWMNLNAPRASRGVVGGLTGTDVTGPAALQMPQSGTDWLGPFISDAVKVYSNVLREYTSGEKPIPRTGGELVGAAAAIPNEVSPLFRYWPKLMVDRLAHPAQNGFIIKDPAGREIYRLTDWDIPRELFGAEPLESAKVRQFQANEKKRIAIENKRKGNVMEAIMGAMEDGNDIPDHIFQEMMDMGISMGSIRREAKMRALPPEMRFALQQKLAKRADILDRHPLIGE